ncbi:MAG: sulfatase-like hydrolase/transferase, partial [Acidimicrobiia bacterium]
FAFLFLVFSPASHLLSRDTVQASSGSVGATAPVVMIVFDEFPVASLIDGEGNLEEDQYPNFARLAREGTWYRNAVSVRQQTEEAIPVMLTGREPTSDEAIPVAADYPFNLFTLLADVYQVRASEAVTELCPAYACAEAAQVKEPPAVRWRSLADDLAVVAGHLLLPSDISEDLPPIEQTWGNFATADTRATFDIIARFNDRVEADRRRQVDDFLAILRAPTDQPTLYFAHLLFPHIPWTYLPSGQSYPASSPAPGSTPTGWEDDEWLVAQAYQRHLLQVQYADTIIGEVLGALDEAGRFDETLLVVLADHGTADVPNVDHRRVVTPETVGHIAAIPLFIKHPFQELGGVDDYRAETLDLLPTIADLLDVRIPWSTEGVSLAAPQRPEREATTVVGSQGPITFGVTGFEKLAASREQKEWFDDRGPWGLAPVGQDDLLGAELSELTIEPGGSVTAALTHPDWYREVDPAADPFPALMTGRLGGSPDGDLVLAVAINGRVAAVTRTYQDDEGSTRFQVMVPPTGFRDGRNQVELLVVEGTGADRILRTLGP